MRVLGGVLLKTTDRDVSYRLTPGHEVAGVIDSMGEQAGGFSVNEKVLVFPWIGEGLCPACRIGQENLCDKPRSLGVYTDGGYSEYLLVPSTVPGKNRSSWILMSVPPYHARLLQPMAP